ncbi:hypothetical protein ABT340_25540 [Streptosporangium sp. NPDC000239]|uniref:hypothetical protein n=1 Tax=Streptosporangium sp. NPDC000239 TaxID=3154248 RepID=UPI0033308096
MRSSTLTAVWSSGSRTSCACWSRCTEEITRRWGVIDLLDLVKNVDHATKFTGEFTSVASRTVTDAKVLRRRLLLCTFVLGTNSG